MAEKMDVCPYCHEDYSKDSKWPHIYKCKRCGTYFCDSCNLNYRGYCCPSCGRENSYTIVQRNIPKTPDELKKIAIAEAKKRAEEGEANRRAETLKELENRHYGLGMRIGNRYYYDDY